MSAGASGEGYAEWKGKEAPSDDAMELAVWAYHDMPRDAVRAINTCARKIDALVQRKVERERERCCRAVCKHCAEGNEPRPARDYDQPMHLFQGYPPRVCAAAAIRAPKEGA